VFRRARVKRTSIARLDGEGVGRGSSLRPTTAEGPWLFHVGATSTITAAADAMTINAAQCRLVSIEGAPLWNRRRQDTTLLLRATGSESRRRAGVGH